MYKKTADKRKVVDSRGFSLIDLLLTLTLSGILLSLAFPAYNHVIIDVRLSSLAERITSAINIARSEAMKRRAIVIICSSKNGKTCTGRWRDGWIIFFGKNTRDIQENNLLYVYPPLNKNEFLEWHGSGGRDYVQLNPDGSAYGHNGSFIVCVKVLSMKLAYRISLSQTGRLRVEKKVEFRKRSNVE